jgi:hypothetical protein
MQVWVELFVFTRPGKALQSAQALRALAKLIAADNLLAQWHCAIAC